MTTNFSGPAGVAAGALAGLPAVEAFGRGIGITIAVLVGLFVLILVERHFYGI